MRGLLYTTWTLRRHRDPSTGEYELLSDFHDPAVTAAEGGGDVGNDCLSVRHISRCGTWGFEFGRDPHFHLCAMMSAGMTGICGSVQFNLRLFPKDIPMSCLFCTLIYSGCLPMVSIILFFS